jgi:ABC-type transport system substrate-binding protein
MKLHIVLTILLVLQTVSCSFVLDIGMEPEPTSSAAAPTVTVMATELPTSTPTILPTSVPTDTPMPTPLPGSVVIPVTSLGSDIPWLPLDTTRYPTTVVVTFNTQIPPFNNPLVRKAFAASVDRDAIVQMAEKWYAVDPSPATTFLHPMTLGRALFGEVGINYDPALAKDLLAQAGYSDPSAFPKVTFIVNSYGDTAPGAKYNMASAMAQAWHSTLGVTVEVQALARLSFGDRIKSNPPELFWIGWLPDPGNDPSFIRDNYHTNGQYNYGHFSNPDFDALVDRAATLHDPAERQALYIQAERILCETEVGIIPLYFTYSNIP